VIDRRCCVPLGDAQRAGDLAATRTWLVRCPLSVKAMAWVATHAERPEGTPHDLHGVFVGEAGCCRTRNAVGLKLGQPTGAVNHLHLMYHLK
jgi:hypothetical protein